MTRAVHFDGSTELRSLYLGQSAVFSRPFGCGILSYWVRTSATVSATVFLAYSDSPQNPAVQGHCVRAVHVSGRPSFQIQNPSGQAFATSAIWDAVSPLPPDDRWHHVCFGWDVSVFPPIGVYALDSARQLTIMRVTPMGPFEVDYAVTDVWTIGAENLLTSNPLYRDEYTGDLAELYLLADTTYRDVTSVIMRGFTVHVPYVGDILVGGTGFTTPKDEAMEIGPDGSRASGVPPQLYCSVDPDGRDPRTFKVNRGTAGRVFSETGNLVLADSDPFPSP